MASVFTKLSIGDAVASIGGRVWKKLSTEVAAEAASYLTFSSPNVFTLGVVDNTKYWNGTLEYSTDAQTWNTWSGTSAISSSADGKLYMRGTGNTVITGSTASDTVAEWVLTGSNISCDGNIETLLDYATVANGEHPTMAAHCYRYMFCYCAGLTTTPALPATTLAEGCYYDMFACCTGLTTAPALPATTLADYCYFGMFGGCTSLTRAPALPATTLAAYCYRSMFNNCTGLTTAPALPATTLAEGCYRNMFAGCTSLTTTPALPATTLAASCYMRMFSGGCTSLTTIPALPATTLANYCYNAMFAGCTNIKLSTTQTGEYQTAYRIPTSGTGTTATTALSSMFYGTGGTFADGPSINTTYYTSNTVVYP